MLRTHTAGELRPTHAGQSVTLTGWVNRRRDHGGLIFVDLRDRYGLAQLVFNPSLPEVFHTAEGLRSEFVIQVVGTVTERPAEMINPNIATGEIEVRVESLTILNAAKPAPFGLSDDNEVNEELRLKYRYLDLRRPRMQRNLLLRHKVINFIRNYLDERSFIEVETPILIKSTPEGARDFLVPSRLHPGYFYALPQSPQQLKQLLMVSGFDRYFQIARCFRDEDLRGDRQPEFTQLDLEMSFIEREDILNLNETMMTKLIETLLPDKRLLFKPFLRLSYADAMEYYGSDKPDLRFDLRLVNLGEVFIQSEFRVFKDALTQGGQIKAIRIPGGGDYSRKQIDEMEAFVKSFGAKGLAWVKVGAGGELSGSAAKFITDGEHPAFLATMQAVAGDLIVMVADNHKIVADSLGRLRLFLGDKLGLRDPNIFAFAWVLDFPLVEWNDDEHRWDAMHHPFTSPRDEDLHLMDENPGQVRAKAYDMVVNGWEIAGGSIRIHRRDVQGKLFSLLNIDDATQESRFGHMLSAFEYGAPPHGGIAWGLDRVVMLFAGEMNIREVIAFPKTTTGTDLMTDAPSEVDAHQLRDLHIGLAGKALKRP